MNLLSIYQEEMQKIDASEKLSMITAFAVGGGNLKKSESTRILNQIQKASEGPRAKREKPATSPQALAAMGIGIEVVKKGVKASG